jgi:hypothetical protein
MSDSTLVDAGAGAAVMGVVTAALWRLQTWLLSRGDKRKKPEEESKEPDTSQEPINGNRHAREGDVRIAIHEHQEGCLRLIDTKLGALHDSMGSEMGNIREGQERVEVAVDRLVDTISGPEGLHVQLAQQGARLAALERGR